MKFLRFGLVLLLVGVLLLIGCTQGVTPAQVTQVKNDLIAQIDALSTRIGALEGKTGGVSQSDLNSQLDTLESSIDSDLSAIRSRLEVLEVEEEENEGTTDEITRWGRDVYVLHYDSDELYEGVSTYYSVKPSIIEEAGVYGITLTLTNAKVIGIAHQGDKTTLVDSALTQEDGFWNGARLTITSTEDNEAPKWETAVVTSFTAATNTLHFSPELTAPVDSGDSYEVELGTKDLVVEFDFIPRSSAKVKVDESHTYFDTVAFPYTAWDVEVLERDGYCLRILCLSDRLSIPIGKTATLKLEFTLAYK